MPKIQKIDERNMESFVQTVITICDPSTNETTKAEKLKRLENTLKIFETDVNDPHGKTCLQHLLERRKFDAAKFLLENSDPKPNLNHEDRSKTTLLEKAIDGLDEITVQWLLTNGADVNYFSSTNSTPLTKAIQMYPFSLNNIKTLLRHGADRNLIGCQNATPLMISLAGSELNPIFQLLVNDPLTDLDKPCPNLDGVFPLYQATCSGSVEQMRQLLDKGANIEQVTPKNETALSVASARYEIEKVKLLLERKANPNYVIHIELGKTTNYLHRLVSLTKPETKQRDLAVARLLLQFEADPNATVEPEGSAFHLAVQFGKIEFVKLFLQKCSLFDIQSGIFTAISCNKPMIIDLFINHPRFDPKFRDDDGHGLITAACIMPPPNQTFKELNRIRKEIVDSPRIAPSRKSNKSGTDVDFKLLERFVNLGAPIDIQNMFGQNALYLASLKNNTNAVRFLLSKNANPKLVCIDGSTALHAAASYGNTELITLLLRCGVDVNIQMHDGTTPLMMAAQEGEVPAVKLLLANKADTT
ncbi:MAG: ankyrin repeat domain-containing protein, partial [Gammaproteobacteria bacterium]